MDAKKECSTCGKELNNMNNHNASKHLESCKAKEKKNKDKAKRKNWVHQLRSTFQR